MFKCIEVDKCGVRILLPFTEREIYRLLLGFINHVDLMANGVNAEMNMQQNMNTYVLLYKAIVAKISEPKVFHY